MKRISSATARFWLICAVCVFAIGTVGCCDCGENCCDCENCGGGESGVIQAADQWLVIHDKVNTEGTPWANCVPPSADDNVAYLPNCLDVEMGDTVGIANYSQTDITVKHFSSLDAPNPVSIPSRQAMIFTVIVEGDRVGLEIESDVGHGGPAMIVRP